MAFRKRRTKRRRRQSRKTTSISRVNPSTPLGQKFLFKSKYFSDALAINPSAGGVAQSQVFSLNGLYDPDITNVGHQVLGFDQMVGSMYNHYTVIGAKIKVWLTNISSEEVVAILQVKDTAGTSSDTVGIIENGNCVYTTLSQAGQGGDVKMLSTGVSMNKYFGRKVLQDQDSFSGTSTKNPDEQVYAHIIISPNTTADLSGVRLTAEIQYVAMLTEPRQLTTS